MSLQSILPRQPCPSSVSAILRSTRPPFLLLTPICVFIGVAVSAHLSTELDYSMAAWVLVGALFSHISVNTFNEYMDYASGLDLQTVKTPFSGGSGAIPENPRIHQSVLLVATVSLLLTCIIGVYLVAHAGWPLLLIGGLGTFIILSYTPLLNRVPWLCLLSPGLAFGPLFVLGTFISITPPESVQLPSFAMPLLYSLPAFFLVNGLLLINQIPDIAADRAAGRRTFPSYYGVEASMQAYLALILLAGASIIAVVVLTTAHHLVLFSLFPLVLGLQEYYRWRHSEALVLRPLLEKNVAMVLLTLCLFGMLSIAALVYFD